MRGPYIRLWALLRFHTYKRRRNDNDWEGLGFKAWGDGEGSWIVLSSVANRRTMPWSPKACRRIVF